MYLNTYFLIYYMLIYVFICTYRNIIFNGSIKMNLFIVLVCQGCHHKIPETGWLNQHNFSHSSEGGSPRLRCWQNWFLVKLFYQVFTWPFFCAFTFLVSLLLIRTLILLGQGPILMTSFNLNHSLQGSISIQLHWELGFQPINLGVHNLAHNTHQFLYWLIHLVFLN